MVMANARGFLGRRQESRAPGREPKEVAKAAYALYEQRGRSDGHALEDWIKAEELVKNRHHLAQ